MRLREALTFDDVLLVPGASDVLPAEADTRTFITPEIALNIPLISSAMDTVTEAKMAIAMAQAGGLGVIHRNLSVEDQAAEVRSVKRFVSGVVDSPVTLCPEQTLKDAKALQAKYRITGFPVVDKAGVVLGIVTNRDMRFATDDATPVSVMMTSEDLAMLEEPADLGEAKSLMEARRIEKLLVVDRAGRLTGLLTIKDIEQAVLNPLAVKDEQGRLRVAAASSVGDAGYERSLALIDAGVDVVVIDTAHGHSSGVSEAVTRLKRHNSGVQVVAGNVATAEGDPGAHRRRRGRGQGGDRAGLDLHHAHRRGRGRAADDRARRLRRGRGRARQGRHRRRRHQVFRRLRQGDRRRGALRHGRLDAGRHRRGARRDNPVPGTELQILPRHGLAGAMARGSADRYFQKEASAEKLVPEGVEGQVPYKGAVSAVLHQLVGGLRAAMGYTGSRTIADMRTGCQFVRISAAGLRESHVHDVQITRESPNYRLG